MIDSAPSALHKKLQANILERQPVKDTAPEVAIKILSLEDNIGDQLLISHELKRSGLTHEVLFVDNQADFESALTGFNPDIILSDYNLPSYHGVDAFYTAHKELPYVPFILISGAVGELRAVEMIKGGVTDYVIKDAMFTLPSVIDRAMKEAKVRREKEQAHAELRMAAYRLARAQALSHLGSWEVNLIANTGVWSDEACRIHGLETTNNLHNFESWFSFIHPDDKERVGNEIKAHYNAPGNITFNYRILRPGGQVRYLYTEAQFERDETGRPVTMQGVVHDITTRHEAEEKLKQSEAGLARAQAVAHLGNWETDAVTLTGYWSDETLRIYGIEPGNNMQPVSTFLLYVHPDDREYVSNLVQQTISELKEASIYHRIVRKDGSVRYIHTEAKHEFDANGKHTIIHGTSQDITESKLAEEKLKQSEAGLARAQALAHIGSWEMDPVTTLSTLSEECCRIYGLEPGKRVMSVNEYLAIIHPDDKERMTKGVAQSVNDLTDVSIYHRIVHKNGDVRYIHTEAKHEFDAHGQYKMLHGTAHDVTPQHEAAEKLKQSEARLARAQEVAHLGNWELDLDTSAAYWSDETLRIFGMMPGQNVRVLQDFIALVHPDDLSFVTKKIAERIAMHNESEFEHRIIRKDGTVRHIHNQGIHQFDPTGKKRLMHGIVQDVTERVERQNQLKQSEARLARAQQVAHLGNWELDLDTGVAFWDDETLRICGLTPGQNTHAMQEYMAMIHPEDIAFVGKEIEDSIVHNTNSSIEHRVVRPDGTVRYIHNMGTHQPDPTGKKRIMHGIVQDITERKVAELKLNEVEQSLKELFDNTADYIYSVDTDYRLTTFNKAFANNFYSLFAKWPVIGDNFIDIIPADIRNITRSRYQKAFKGEAVSLEEEYRLGDRHQWYSTRYNAIIRNGKTVGLAMFASNVTERKLAENKLHESEQNLKDVFENTSDAICSVDKDHRLISFNKAFAENFSRMTGMEPVQGTAYNNTISPETSAELRTNFDRAMGGERVTTVNDYAVGSKTFWFSVRYSPIMRDGVVTGVAIFSSDITKQKTAETLLHKSFDELQLASEKQSAILNTLPANIALLDKNGVVIKVNDAWRKFAYENNMQHGNSGLGENYITVSRAAGGPNAEAAHQMADALTQIIAGNLEKFSIEYACHSPEKQRWFKAEVRPLEGYDELGAVVMHLDITDRNKAEEEVKNLNRDLEKKIAQRTAQLEQANKEMEAFSYTVSHDLRSPLQVINGYASILEKKYKPQLDAGATELLAGIKSNTMHMSQLIADLLNFSHLGRAELKRNPILMKDLVTVVVNELKANTPNFKHAITVHPLKSVTADAALMHQVWVNLIANAIKYSGNKPNPTIEIGMTRINNEDVFYVKDNGAGFDMQYYDKLFTVFHRLHKPSEFEGTGVGLALVHSVITRHGGRVWAEAKVNEGATFYFTLPDTSSN